MQMHMDFRVPDLEPSSSGTASARRPLGATLLLRPVA